MGTFDQLNSSITLVRELISAKEKLQVAELQVKLADVLSNLAEIKTQMTVLQEKNSDLKRNLEGRDINSELRRAFKIHPVEGCYYLETEVSGFKPGCYCLTCFDNSEKINRLKPDGAGSICPACKTGYYQEVINQNSRQNNSGRSRLEGFD